MRDLDHVVIIGGGFSGVAFAAELLRRRARLDVTIVESGDRLGRGVAYGTPVASHLLNTRANQMSLLADDSEHFVRWSRRRGFAAHGPEFLPRRQYGDYLEESRRDLSASPSPTRLTVHLQAGALDLIPQGERAGCTATRRAGLRRCDRSRLRDARNRAARTGALRLDHQLHGLELRSGGGTAVRAPADRARVAARGPVSPGLRHV